MHTAKNIYTRVTDKIIADLEQGVRPWTKPWTGKSVSLPIRHCGTRYRGINIFLLWSEAVDKGYDSHLWMTYRQAAELGGQVRRGEHGSLSVYANKLTVKDSDDADIERQITFMRGYTVFNADQIEGLPSEYYNRPAAPVEPMQLIQNAEAFFNATGATLRHGNNRAYYAPSLDLIHLPHPETFKDAEHYAATKAHELIHWTSHPTRLNRTLGVRFGDAAHAAEELIAELGAAILCATLGITAEVREDHAAYLGHWLKILKADSRAIFTAASHAQRAVEFLEALQRPKEAAA